MIANESLNIAGALRILKKTPHNKIVEEMRVNNSITLAGRELVATLFNFTSKIEDMKRVTKIKLGTGTKIFNPNDTGLDNEIHSTNILSIDHKEIKESDGTPRKQLIISGELKEDECNDALTEAGLFTEDNIMYNRVVFASINKSNNFRLTLIWEITF